MLYSPPDSRARRDAKPPRFTTGTGLGESGPADEDVHRGIDPGATLLSPARAARTWRAQLQVNPSVSPMRADPRLHSALAIVGVHIPVCGSAPSGGDRFLALLVLAIFFPCSPNTHGRNVRVEKVDDVCPVRTRPIIVLPYKTIGSVNWQQGLAIFEHTLGSCLADVVSGHFY